jgi:hypothetical protein
MTREKLNRWGEPEETDPTLYVDEWFPSEKSHQSPGMESLSRAFVPIGIILGLILAAVAVSLVTSGLGAEPVNAPLAIAGGGLGAWALLFLVPYGTLVYYAIKKQVLISRRTRGLPIDLTPEDIDDYTLPLYTVPGVARLMMGQLSSGGKTTPLGMKRARVATIVAAVLFFVAVVVLTIALS